MATTITCDKCKEKILKPIRVEFNDGEHPHNGDTMTTVKDLCIKCFHKLDLKMRSFREWDEFRSKK